MKFLFHTNLSQKLYFIVAFLGVFNCTVSCTPKISIIEKINFSEALALSQTTQKPIFFMIGGGNNCIPCHDLKKQLRSSKILGQLNNGLNLPSDAKYLARYPPNLVQVEQSITALSLSAVNSEKQGIPPAITNDAVVINTSHAWWA